MSFLFAFSLALEAWSIGRARRAIAKLLDLPVGTVASRLRRARQLFLEAAEKLRAALAEKGEVAP